MNNKKIASGLPKLTKNHKPQEPDLMGEPPSCFHFGVFKSKSGLGEIQKKADEIFKKALAAKKKAGK